MAAWRFLKKAAALSAPFWIYAGLIAICDPFDFLHTPSPISDEVKLRCANPLNPCLWRMARYRREPLPNILLGDSRMLALREESVSAAAGARYANLAYGGASLKECFDTFWFATALVRLRNVYLGVNFNTYNDYNNSERTRTYSTIAANPALYFVNRTVAQAAAYSYYSAIWRVDLGLGRPTLDRAAFWRDELSGPVTTRMFRNYIPPKIYRQQLEQITHYCQEHGIRLTFIIFPTHTDLQKEIEAHGWEEANARMRRELAALGPVYDFDYPSRLTETADYFNDPMHLKQEGVDAIVREVWKGESGYARRY